MRRRFCYTIILGICLAVLWLSPVGQTLRLFWSFDHLERHAKKVITGSELQTWATNLLAHPPPNGWTYGHRLGTNFPKQLLPLYHQPPAIVVFEPNTNSS